MDFLKAYGLPGFLVRKANRGNLERGGKDLTSSCVPDAVKITVPTLLVQAKHDPWTNMDSVKAYYDPLQVVKDVFWIKGIKEHLATYDYFNHAPEKMLAFFGNYL